jgi:2-hydroxychromene-2-carboxylate isomerase
MIPIDVYVSLNSPWTYLSWARLRVMAATHDLKLTVKPTRFADVFAATGGLPLPKRAPERQRYRMMELRRWRDRLGIPIVLEPKGFPSDETPGARLVIAAGDQGLDTARLMEEIGRALWEREESVADATVLAAAARRAGLDADAIRAAGRSDADLDLHWIANTTEAVSRGVFGAPSFVLPDGEIFWGQDRLDLLDWRLSSRA